MNQNNQKSLLADLSIAELKTHSKWDWLFAVFELYVDCCYWEEAHPIKGLNELERKQFIENEISQGFPRYEQDFSPFRFWNRLIILPGSEIPGSHCEEAPKPTWKGDISALETFGGFRESYLRGGIEGVHISPHRCQKLSPVKPWLYRVTADVERAYDILNSPDTLHDTLHDLLIVPDNSLLEEPLDLWPDYEFSPSCYYFVNLFAHWVKNEPAFFSNLPDTKAQKPQEQSTNSLPVISQTKEELKSDLPVIKINSISSQVYIGYSLITQRKQDIKLLLELYKKGTCSLESLKKAVWEDLGTPDNWESELRNRISLIRGSFNSNTNELGSKLIPDAVNGTYKLDRSIAEILITEE